MKKFLLAALLLPLFSQAQWNVNLFGGFSNYNGDLQSQVYTTQQAYLSFGAGIQYDLNPHFSLLSNLTYGKVGASDSYSHLADLRSHKITPYVFVGAAVYHFNPYAADTTGKKVYLRPLSTEGEGLPQYPARKEYALTQMAIPFGGGIKFRITDRVTLAYEIGVRKLFTDHLDDVSNSYVSEPVLLAAKGSEAVEMAYRGNELKDGPAYPAAGTPRGGPKHNDWYYMSGLRVTIALNDGSAAYRRHKGILDCPGKVY
jgi:Domain of unknown function (DUF6089)